MSFLLSFSSCFSLFSPFNFFSLVGFGVRFVSIVFLLLLCLLSHIHLWRSFNLFYYLFHFERCTLFFYRFNILRIWLFAQLLIKTFSFPFSFDASFRSFDKSCLFQLMVVVAVAAMVAVVLEAVAVVIFIVIVVGRLLVCIEVYL